MPETKIVTEAGMKSIADGGITVIGAGGGVVINQAFLQNQGAASTIIGAVATIGGAWMIHHNHKLSGGAVLGAGLANVFLGLYDLATGNVGL